MQRTPRRRSGRTACRSRAAGSWRTITDPLDAEPPPSDIWRRPGAGDEPTYTVSQLGAELKDLLGEVYRSLWVVGEAQRVRPSARGHLYFELVEKGTNDDIIGKIDAVLWRTDHVRVARALRSEGQRIDDGHEIRCRGQIDYYGPGGRLQLIVREVDPVFALGLLARRRRETLDSLKAAGLLTRNRELSLPALPLRIALVTSEGSAAYHDFLAGLAASPYGFVVEVLSSAVQGSAAERELAASLERAGDLERRHPGRFDVVALVRGGGARTDLAAFDSQRVAEAVARCPLPVLTGLGHEIDQAVADVVAHRAFKTPSDVAAYLVGCVGEAESSLVELCLGLERAARQRLEIGRRAIRRAAQRALETRARVRQAGTRVEAQRRRLAQLAARRLGAAGRHLSAVAERIESAAPRAIERWRPQPERILGRIAERARGRIKVQRATVDGHARLVAELAPSRLLARGFSITRDAAGQVIRSPAAVESGAHIFSEVAEGRIRSRVEEEPRS